MFFSWRPLFCSSRTCWPLVVGSSLAVAFPWLGSCWPATALRPPSHCTWPAESWQVSWRSSKAQEQEPLLQLALGEQNLGMFRLIFWFSHNNIAAEHMKYASHSFLGMMFLVFFSGCLFFLHKQEKVGRTNGTTWKHMAKSWWNGVCTLRTWMIWNILLEVPCSVNSMLQETTISWNFGLAWSVGSTYRWGRWVLELGIGSQWWFTFKVVPFFQYVVEVPRISTCFNQRVIQFVGLTQFLGQDGFEPPVVGPGGGEVPEAGDLVRRLGWCWQARKPAGHLVKSWHNTGVNCIYSFWIILDHFGFVFRLFLVTFNLASMVYASYRLPQACKFYPYMGQAMPGEARCHHDHHHPRRPEMDVFSGKGWTTTIFSHSL